METKSEKKYKMSGAQILIKLLEKQGIKYIAGIPGGSNLPMYDALSKSSIVHVLARHEQGAGFIAQGMARVSGKPEVCFATSGPGATNLLTAIADAKLDSVPVIAITGQVDYSLVGTDAFQEVDTYGLSIPITKHNFLVRSAEELLTVIPNAFQIASSGRPGPVLIDIPKNVQNEVIEFDDYYEPSYIDVKYELNDDIFRAVNLVNSSKKPVIYMGGGVINSDACDVLKEICIKANIPAVSSLMGLGCFSVSDPLFLGMLGMHGARYTNYILNEADLLIGLGVRFDDRATGNVSKFCPNAKIIHIDIDESEINKIRDANISIVADVGKMLKKMKPLIKNNDREEWIQFIAKLKDEMPFLMPNKEDCFHPLNIISKIGELAEAETIITTDVGEHQMWVAQSYPFKKPRTLLTSGSLGTMGFGLPAAIGASLAAPSKKVICISGDGSILMNIQELATLNDLKCNVCVVIINNHHLGLVRQQQEMFYNGNYIASEFASNPDFAKIAEGFGVKGFCPENEEELECMLKEAISFAGPCLIDIHINEFENVLPIVPPGAGNTEMIGGEYFE